MTEVVYRRPKQMPEARAKHTDSTPEFRVFVANQDVGIPSVLISELTGISKNDLVKIMHNTGTIPLGNIARTHRFLTAVTVAQELKVLPTSDYGVIRSILALCYTVLNLEDDIAEMRDANG